MEGPPDPGGVRPNPRGVMRSFEVSESSRTLRVETTPRVPFTPRETHPVVLLSENLGRDPTPDGSGSGRSPSPTSPTSPEARSVDAGADGTEEERPDCEAEKPGVTRVHSYPD